MCVMVVEGGGGLVLMVLYVFFMSVFASSTHLGFT